MYDLSRLGPPLLGVDVCGSALAALAAPPSRSFARATHSASWLQPRWLWPLPTTARRRRRPNGLPPTKALRGVNSIVQ